MTTSTQKRRGSAAEREVAKAMGGERIGQQLGPVDVRVKDYADLQVKKVKTLPSLNAVAKMLDAMPEHGVLRGAVVIQAAGQGVRGRRLITFDFDEYAGFHGGGEHE